MIKLLFKFSISACFLSAVSGDAATDGSASRVITLGGAITEIVYALDAGDQVVAVDDSSTYPAATDDLPKVGYYRMISAEGVLSLHPDLIITTTEAGPPQALAKIRQAGVDVVTIPHIPGLEGCRQRILEVGQALERREQAEALNNDLDRQLTEFEADAQSAPSVLFIYARGAGTLNVSGAGTAADEMIRLAGGRNAVTEFSGYRPLTAESVVKAQPDILLLTTSGLESVGGVDGLLGLPGLNATPAGRDRRIATMDDLKLLGFGPRVIDAVRELHQAFYP